MAYPTAPTSPIVVIATDTNFNAPGDDWDATPTKTAPTTAIEDQGYVPGDARPADVDNYLFSTLALWGDYASDFCDELKIQKVQGPASSTDNAIARFDSTTGKIVQNSAMTVADTTGELVYATPPSRTIRISGSAFTPGSPDNTAPGGGAYFGSQGPVFSFLLTGAAGGQAILDIGSLLRTGAILTAVTVRVDATTVGPGTPMAAILHETTGDGTDTASTTVSESGSGAVQNLGSFSTLPITVDRGKRLSVEVVASSSQTGAIATGDKILYVDLAFTDPGPRNF